MEIYLNRNGKGKKPDDLFTIGELSVLGFKCFTLEDDYDEVKEYAHTRIPAGRYEIKLRTDGRLHEKYKKLYPGTHIGMLHIQDIPNYTYVYMHRGNKADHTAGCPLLGMEGDNAIGRLKRSAEAYIMMYVLIVNELSQRRVFINIKD